MIMSFLLSSINNKKKRETNLLSHPSIFLFLLFIIFDQLLLVFNRNNIGLGLIFIRVRTHFH